MSRLDIVPPAGTPVKIAVGKRPVSLAVARDAGGSAYAKGGFWVLGRTQPSIKALPS